MRKTKKAAILTIFMAAVLTVGAIPASAEALIFEINRSESAKPVAYNTKDIAGSTWYISNFRTTYSNFIEDRDVIGFKVKGKNNDVPYSSYHTFSKFVNDYPLAYTSTPENGAPLKLNAQIDSAGQFDNIRYEGQWRS